jgi:hypothetical protein
MIDKYKGIEVGFKSLKLVLPHLSSIKLKGDYNSIVMGKYKLGKRWLRR